jgi:hypothetical protein
MLERHKHAPHNTQIQYVTAYNKIPNEHSVTFIAKLAIRKEE